MSLRHGLLGLLNYESMTGYELNKEFNASLGHFWQAKASQIYRELDAMEQSGWLTSERIIQDEKPNKRVYSLTQQGRAEFLNWLTLLDPMKNTMRTRSTFLMRVFFGGELSKDATVELLRSLRQTANEYTRELESIQATIDQLTREGGIDPKKTKYWKLTALYGELMNKVGAQWADKAIAILEEDE